MTLRLCALLMLVFPVLHSCSEAQEALPAPDPVAQDSLRLSYNFISYQLTYHRLLMLHLRASVARDTGSEAYRAYRATVQPLFAALDAATDSVSNRQALHRLYSEHRTLATFVKHYSEDAFPPLADAPKEIHQIRTRPPGHNPAIEYNMEHAAMSVLSVFHRPCNTSVPFYECSRTDMSLLPETEAKLLLRLFRGTLFFKKGFHYLANREFHAGIEWLHAQPNAELVSSKQVLNLPMYSNGAMHTYLSGLFHAMRGSNKLFIDSAFAATATADLDQFNSSVKTLGLSNELAWSVEAYSAMQRGNSIAAIAATEQLKNSAELTPSERSQLQAAIDYLEHRDPETVLKDIYTRHFVGNLLTRHLFAKGAAANWPALCQQTQSINVEAALAAIEQSAHFMRQMQVFTQRDSTAVAAHQGLPT